MVKTHTVSLACIQRRANEAGSPEGKLHRRCKEDAEWSDAIRQQIVLDNRRRLVDSRYYELQPSTSALKFADLEGLPSNNTMGPVNARPLQDVRLNHDEGNREERPGRFLVTRAPIGQHVKMFKQLSSPPGDVKEGIYPKLVNQDGDAQRYGGLIAIKKD